MSSRPLVISLICDTLELLDVLLLIALFCYLARPHLRDGECQSQPVSMEAEP